MRRLSAALVLMLAGSLAGGAAAGEPAYECPSEQVQPLSKIRSGADWLVLGQIRELRPGRTYSAGFAGFTEGVAIVTTRRVLSGRGPAHTFSFAYIDGSNDTQFGSFYQEGARGLFQRKNGEVSYIPGDCVAEFHRAAKLRQSGSHAP